MSLFLFALLLSLLTAGLLILAMRKDIERLNTLLSLSYAAPVAGVRRRRRRSFDRAILATLAVFLLSIALAANAKAETPGVTNATPSVFGTVALRSGRTGLQEKWDSVRTASLPQSGAWTALVARTQNASDAEKVAAVNAWVNGRVRFAADQANYGKSDFWATAARTLATGRGDCEDYAIAKMQLLRALGFRASDLYLVIGRDVALRSDHAVLMVRVDGRMVGLDNLTDRLLETEKRSDFRPIFTFSSASAWVHGYRTAETAR